MEQNALISRFFVTLQVSNLLFMKSIESCDHEFYCT